MRIFSVLFKKIWNKHCSGWLIVTWLQLHYCWKVKSVILLLHWKSLFWTEHGTSCKRTVLCLAFPAWVISTLNLEQDCLYEQELISFPPRLGQFISYVMPSVNLIWYHLPQTRWTVWNLIKDFFFINSYFLYKHAILGKMGTVKPLLSFHF